MIRRLLHSQVSSGFISRIALALAAAGLVLVTGVVGIAAPAQATAGINKTLNFQGRLLTNAGAVVADGNYNMRFKVYQDGPGNVAGDTGGTLMWTELWQNSVASGSSTGVVVKNGYFSVNLGTYCAFAGGSCQGNTNTAVDFNQDTLWLSMDVAGTAVSNTPTYDGELLPMRRLASSVYALQAENANKLGGLTSSQFLQTVPASSSVNVIAPTAASTVALTVKATTAGSTNSLEVFDSAGTRQAYFDANGALNVAQSIQPTVTNTTDIGLTGTQFRSGYFGTSVITPTLDTNSAVALNIGGTNASAINIGKSASNIATTITGTTVIKPVTDASSELQVQNSNAEPLLLVDTTTTNILKNSGFEAGTGNWAARGTTSVFATDSTAANVYHGTKSLKATVTAATSGMGTTGGQAAFTTNILSGTQYQLTFYAKCDSTYATLTYGREDVAGTPINSSTSGNCTTSWQQFTAHWTTGGTITNPDIFVNLGATTAGSVWIDGVSLVQTSTSAATNYAIGKDYFGGIMANPAIFQNGSDSTAALQIQNAAGTNVVNVDTTNAQLSVRNTTDAASLGGELITTTDFTQAAWTSTNWTVATTTAQHNTGNTSALSTNQVTVTAGATYQVTFTITGSPTSGETITPKIGGQNGKAIYGNSAAQTQLITTTTNGSFQFVPTSNWNGTISAVSVKLVTLNSSALAVRDSSNTTQLEVRAASSYQAVGYQALQSNTSGTGNSAFGIKALMNNTSGGNNTANGANALQSNTTGANNTAVGTSALQASTTASNNVAIGYDALQLGTTSGSNVAVGTFALQNTTTGGSNVALGYQTLNNNTTGSKNTALGYQAGYQDPNVASFNTVANLSNTTTIGYGSQVQASNSLILGGQGTSAVNVGIGTTSPTNTFSVSPDVYDTGTAGTGGSPSTTITGSGTTWTAAMVGDEFIFADGTKRTITGFTSTTQITVNSSVTEAAGQSYRIHQPALQVSSAGNVGIGTAAPTANLQVTTQSNTTTAFQVQNAGAATVLNVDTTNSIVSIAGALDTATAAVMNIGTVNATAVNIATNAAAHTIAIASGAAVQGVTIGSTNSTSSLTLQSGTLGTVLSSTGALSVKNGSNILMAIDASGDVTHHPSADSTAAFQLLRANSEVALRVDTSNNRVKVGDDSAASYATIAFVGQATNSAVNVSSLTTTRTTTSGNLLVLSVGTNSTAGTFPTGVTDTAGNTWVQAGTTYGASLTGSRTDIWYAVNAASVTSVTVTMNNSTDTATNLSEYSGVDTSNPFDAAGTNVNSSTTTHNTASVTAAGAGELLIGNMSYNTTASTTGPGGSWTSLTNVNQGTVKFLRTAYQVAPSGGSYSATWTTNVAVTSGSVLAAFKPAQGLTTSLFVLDNSATSTAPGGVNGGMYYDTTLNRFQCYENGVYVNCSAAGSLVQAPTSTAINTITPTVNSVVALTVNGTSGTAATALNVVQASAASNITISNTGATSQSLISVSQSTSAYTGTALLINMANGSGTFASGAFVDLQVNSVSKFKVDNSGVATSTGLLAPSLDTASAVVLNLGLTNASSIKVGGGDVSPNGTPVVLVMDSKNTSGDPTGVDGAVYYNSNYKRMRCYVDGQWRFCNDPVGLTWGIDFRDDFLGHNFNSAGIGGDMRWAEDTNGGAGATIAGVAPDLDYRPGQLQLSTGTTTTGRENIYSDSGNVNGYANPFFIGGGEEIEFAINIPTLATATDDYVMRFGLCDNNPNSGTDCGNGVYFEYNRATSVNWIYASAKASTRTKTTSGTAVATGWTRFKITVNAAGASIDYAINGTSLGTAITTNIPNTTSNLSEPSMTIIKTAGTASRSFKIDYFEFRRSLTSPR